MRSLIRIRRVGGTGGAPHVDPAQGGQPGAREHDQPGGAELGAAQLERREAIGVRRDHPGGRVARLDKFAGPSLSLRRVLGHAPTMFRAILLDLDDTLFDRTAAFGVWAEAAARAQLGRSLAPGELATLVELDGRGHRSRTDLAADARAQLGLAIDPDRFGQQLAELVVPEPGVRELIARLATSHRIAVVTNGSSAAQRAKLARLGLDVLVHAVFVSGELGIAKPARGIFEHALRWTEHVAADVVFVGDEPVIDLASAAALGMATAWRARTPWPAELAPPTYRLDRLTDLAEVCA